MDQVNKGYRRTAKRDNKRSIQIQRQWHGRKRSRSSSAAVPAFNTPRPNLANPHGTSSPKKAKRSSSEKKMSYFKPVKPKEATDDDSDLQSVVSEGGVGDDMDPTEYKLLRNDVFQKLLHGLKCPHCKKESLCVKSNYHKGFACKLQVICENCNRIVNQSFTSPQLPNQRGSPFEINKKLVETFLLNGAGHGGLEKMAVKVNMKGVSRKTYSKFVKLLSTESSKTIEVLNMSRLIVREAHIQQNGDLEGEVLIEMVVSYDGSWHKRGHTSAFGVGLVIDVLAGLVVDYEVLGKECAVCNQKESTLTEDEFKEWQKIHKANKKCDINYIGSSNMMEVAIAEILWKRSEDIGFQYTGMLSDGDAKTHSHLSSLNLYKGKKIEKQECINHASKRLFTGLKNVVDKCKAQKITLGGNKAGSLTETKMKTLQSFYTNAIKKNAPNIQLMKTAILATPYHSMSTDEVPQHQFCPGGPESWCFYNRAIASGLKPGPHAKLVSIPLRTDVVHHILDVYERLSGDELLKRCTNLGTQNANESIHSQIWAQCPKSKNTSRKKVEIAVASAVSEFNMGSESTVKLRAKVPGESLGVESVRLSRRRDKERVRKGQAKASSSARHARKTGKVAKQMEERKNLKKEGVTHKAGGFD